LAYAIQRYELVKKTNEPSLLDKAKLSLANLFETVKDSGELIIDKSKNAIGQGLTWIDLEKQKISQFINNFGKSTVIQPDVQPREDGYLNEENQEKQILESNLRELQEKLDDALEKTDILSQENSQLTGEKQNGKGYL